jgi:hypothetical protein
MAMIRPNMRETVDGLMPRLKDDPARLVAIPSVSAPGYPESTHGPLLEAYELVAHRAFRELSLAACLAIVMASGSPGASDGSRRSRRRAVGDTQTHFSPGLVAGGELLCRLLRQRHSVDAKQQTQGCIVAVGKVA